MEQLTCNQTKAISDRIIFDGELNDKGTLFGGKTLALLDENAGLAGFKYVNVKVVTAGYDHLNFWNPITTRDLLRLESYITGSNNRSMEVFTKIIKYDVETYQPLLAFSSFCTLVTLKEFGDQDLPTIVPETDEQKYICAGYEQRVNERRQEHQVAKEFMTHIDLEQFR